MEKQLIGTQLGTTPNSPLTSEYEGATREGTKQLIGTAEPIAFSRSPGVINADTNNGERQLIGTDVPLNHTPFHGWQSHPTAPSKGTSDEKTSHKY